MDELQEEQQKDAGSANKGNLRIIVVGQTSAKPRDVIKGCGVGVKCIYANARSVMNKLDYLRAEVQVIDPDIIAISESWTNESK